MFTSKAVLVSQYSLVGLCYLVSTSRVGVVVYNWCVPIIQGVKYLELHACPLHWVNLQEPSPLRVDHPGVPGTEQVFPLLMGLFPIQGVFSLLFLSFLKAPPPSKIEETSRSPFSKRREGNVLTPCCPCFLPPRIPEGVLPA